jgi:hypothetical protein
MAEEAERSKATIINICRDLRQFGSVYTPSTGGDDGALPRCLFLLALEAATAKKWSS